MGYTVEPGKGLRARMDTRPRRGSDTLTHAIFITDIERFVLKAALKADGARLTDLVERVLEVGLDWEHFEALMPHDPQAVDPVSRAELDRLAEATELLVGEIHVRTGLVDRNGKPFPPFLESPSRDS